MWRVKVYRCVRLTRVTRSVSANKGEKMPDILHRAFIQRLNPCRRTTRTCNQAQCYQSATVLEMFIIVILRLSRTFISVEWEDAGDVDSLLMERLKGVMRLPLMHK